MTAPLLKNKSGNRVDVPRYRIRKEIWALEIDKIEPSHSGRIVLHFVDDVEALLLESDVVKKYMPISGDYLIFYGDGFRAISPRASFTDRHEPI